MYIYSSTKWNFAVLYFSIYIYLLYTFIPLHFRGKYCTFHSNTFIYYYNNIHVILNVVSCFMQRKTLLLLLVSEKKRKKQVCTILFFLCTAHLYNPPENQPLRQLCTFLMRRHEEVCFTPTAPRMQQCCCFQRQRMNQRSGCLYCCTQL